MGPGVSPGEVRRIVLGVYQTFWADVFSTLPLRARGTAEERVELEGAEALQAAVKAGKGVILWESTMFGYRMVGKRALHRLGLRIDQIHSEGHIQGFDHDPRTATWVMTNLVFRFYDRIERRLVNDVISIPRAGSLDYLRESLARLRRGGVLCLAADGPVGRQRLELPFLGRTFSFASGVANLARLSGATVLPYFCFEDEGRLRLIVETPIQIGTSREDGERAVAQFAALLETYVRRYPHQYRGWHLLDLPRAARATN